MIPLLLKNWLGVSKLGEAGDGWDPVAEQSHPQFFARSLWRPWRAEGIRREEAEPGMLAQKGFSDFLRLARVWSRSAGRCKVNVDATHEVFNIRNSIDHCSHTWV